MADHRLVFAKCTYGPTPDPQVDANHRAAIMFAARHGVDWVADLSPDRMGWATARNTVVEGVLEAVPDATGIFWADDDILMPKHAIIQLVMNGLDFCSGLYFQRIPPHYPVAAIYNEDKFNWWTSYPKDQAVLVPVDGVGFGCVYTSTKMLKEMRKKLKHGNDGLFGSDFGKKNTYGEDFAFCLRAAEAGFKPHVDTAIKCGHMIGPSYADEALFQSYRSKLVIGPKE